MKIKLNFFTDKNIPYYFVFLSLFLFFWTPFLFRYFFDIFTGPYENMIDDAYMFVRYAKNILAGYGASWNIDQGPVYGITSQLHFLFIVFLIKFTSLDDTRVVFFSSAIPGFLLFTYLPWVCAKHGSFFSDKSRSWRYFFWLSTAGSAFIYFSKLDFHYKMGMETCLSALLHLCLIDAVLTFSKRPIFLTKILIVFLAFSLFLTRIDNVIVAFAFPFAHLFFVAKKHRDAFDIVIFLSVLILLIECFYKWYFDDFVPLSFYSKNPGYFHGFAEVGKHHVMFSLARFLYGIWPFFCVTLLFYKRKNMQSLAIFLLPVVLTISYYGTMLTIMNLESRYCFPFTVYFVVAGCMYISADNLQKKYWPNILVVLFSAILYLGIYEMDEHRWEVANYFVDQDASCNTADMFIPDLGAPDLPSQKIYVLLDKLADIFKEMPAGAKVVMSEYGYVGAESPQIHIIDVLGLHDRYVARHGFSAAWLFQQKPDAIWVPHVDYTCIDHDIFFSKEFREQYEYYPNPWGYALRKDSIYFPVMKQKLETTFHSLFPGFVMEVYQKHYRQ